jgi:hypothetical protein
VPPSPPLLEPTPRPEKQVFNGFKPLYHVFSCNFHGWKNMKTDETIRLAALKLKQSFSGGDPQVQEWALNGAIQQNPEEAKLHFRNICATIATPLFEDVERLCSTLELSKRQFVELALRDMVEKTNSIVNEVDPFPERLEA